MNQSSHPEHQPISADYEAEIRDRIARLDDDRIFDGGTWLASSVNADSVLPSEHTNVVEDVLQTKTAVIRGSVGVFTNKQYAEFTAHARDDISALLAEIDRLRGELADARQRGQYVSDAYSVTNTALIKANAAQQRDETAPRTERSYWVAIADALNAAHTDGLGLGIDLDGTLTDHNAWSVIWDRDTQQWTVAGYDDEAEADEVPQTADCLGCVVRQCGYDDYHDAHEWGDQPHIRCPGHGYETDAAEAGEQS